MWIAKDEDSIATRKTSSKTLCFNPIFKNGNVALDFNHLTGSLDNQLKKQGYKFTIDSYTFEDVRRSALVCIITGISLTKELSAFTLSFLMTYLNT